MRSRTPSMLFLVAPLRSAAQRFSLSVLIVLSIAAIVLGKADIAAVGKLRAAVDDFFSPILLVLRQPVQAVTDVIDITRETILIRHENSGLRQQNAELLQWQSVARRLQAENTQLRQLLNYQPQRATWFATARVIGTAGGAFSRNLLIDRGSDQGLARGQAALTGTGLVGRISEVGARASRVLMLTDLNSRIPVTIGANHVRAILAGDNSDRPIALYLPAGAALQVGDRVVTSGDGGVLPPDVPVGVVASTDDDQVRIEPATELARVDYLRISDFGLSGVLPVDKVPPPPSSNAKKAANKTTSPAPAQYSVAHPSSIPAVPVAAAKQTSTPSRPRPITRRVPLPDDTSPTTGVSQPVD